MAIDIENIETVADVENMDVENMDMGNSLEAPPSDDAVREEKEARAEQDVKDVVGEKEGERVDE